MNENTFWSIIFPIVQIRLFRICVAITILLLVILLVRKIYQKLGGNNSVVVGWMWAPVILGAFVGKWKMFEVGAFSNIEMKIYKVADSTPEIVFIMTGIGIVVFLGRMVKRARICGRIKTYPSIEQTEITGKIQVKVSNLEESPFSFGLLRKVIVLPRNYREKYTEDQLETVLLREIMHIKCHHHELYFAIMVVQSFGWFNPVLPWAISVFRKDMDKYCDEKLTNSSSYQRKNRYIIPLCGMLLVCLVGIFMSTTWKVERNEAPPSIFIADNKEMGKGVVIPIEVGVWHQILHSETDKELEIDIRKVKSYLLEKKLEAGYVLFVFGDLKVGTVTWGNHPKYINLYDSTSQYVTLSKEISIWKRLACYL